MNHGTLVLVPNALDFGAEPVDIQHVLPLGVLQRAAQLRHWLAEDARSTRAFLKRVQAVAPLCQPLQAMSIVELPRARKASAAPAVDWRMLLAPALGGDELGLISEAGLPAVADPGADAVAAAHTLAIPVLALPGPSSLLLALAASGLRGQSFAFVGYLPQDAALRLARLKQIEALSRRERQTQLFVETPYRNSVLLGALLRGLHADTRLSVSCGLTLPDGWSRSATVAQWRAMPVPISDRTPAVFAVLAG